MNFKVIPNYATSDDDYSGDASYQLKEGGVLVVHHSVVFRDGNEPPDHPGRAISRTTTYAPCGWLRIEE